MAEGVGADVELTAVPLKYPGLAPWEIWLSEAQERMVVAVPPDGSPRCAPAASATASSSPTSARSPATAASSCATTATSCSTSTRRSCTTAARSGR